MPLRRTEATPDALEPTTDRRHFFNWRSENDTPQLANLIAKEFILELFCDEGRLVRLVGGRFVLLNRDNAPAFFAERIAGVRLINHGEPDGWVAEIYEFAFPASGLPGEPDQRTLISLMQLLTEQVVRTPVGPVRLNDQQKFEIIRRFRSGEPAERVGAAYGIDATTVRQVGMAGQ